MTTYTPLTLTGSSASSGSAAFARLLLTQLTLSGSSASSGSATLSQANVAGALDDFAVVPYVSGTELTDPVISGLTDTTVRQAPSDTVNAWQRISITASAPTDYTPGPAGKLYSRAAFARLLVSTDQMPVSSTQYLMYTQFEQTPGGANAYSDRSGINLLDLEQSSYEGRLYYQAAALDGGESYARSTSHASCGRWSGHYTYNTPPAANTYANVKLWGTYANAAANRSTYSALTYLPPPGAPAGTGTGQTLFTLNASPEAWAVVQGGTLLVAQISVATALAGANLVCSLVQYDSTGAVIATTNSGAVTALGSGQWQVLTASTTALSNASWAAVVPRVSVGSAVNTMEFWVDEHRLYVPPNRNQSAVGTSPARPWQPPRQVILKPRATRVNLCQNPGFYNDTAGWVTQLPASITGTWTRALTGGLGGTPAGDFRIATMPTLSLIGSGATPWTGVGTRANTAVASIVAVDLVPAGTQVTYSAYVRAIACPVPVTIWAHDGNALVRGTSTPITTPGAGTPYVRLSVTLTTTVDFGGPAVVNIGYAASDVSTLYQAVTPGTNPQIWQALGTTGTGSRGTWTASTTYSALDTVNDSSSNLYQALVQNGPWTSIGPLEFYVDSVLAEATGELRAYFDGNSPSADYLWEGTPGESRAHYYRGKTVNQYRLDRAIKRALPVGASYQLVYAAPPS